MEIVFKRTIIKSYEYQKNDEETQGNKPVVPEPEFYFFFFKDAIPGMTYKIPAGNEREKGNEGDQRSFKDEFLIRQFRQYPWLIAEKHDGQRTNHKTGEKDQKHQIAGRDKINSVNLYGWCQKVGTGKDNY